MNKWILAGYLLEAKKAVDSLWYISKNSKELYDVYNLCYDNRSRFYINVCDVLDNSVCSHKKKKDVCTIDDIVNRIYTERDKNYAHKDRNYYQMYPYATIEHEVFSLQQDLRHIRDLCKNYLPDCFTLDFVCYDGRLYRAILKIGPKEELEIKKRLYQSYGKNLGEKLADVFILNNIDGLRSLRKCNYKDFAVVLENGLTFEEGIQNRQDVCVKYNALHGTNIWFHIKSDNTIMAIYNSCIDSIINAGGNNRC